MQVEYRCRYVNYPPEDDGWVGVQHLQCPALMDEFHMRIHLQSREEANALRANLADANNLITELRLLAPPSRTTRAASALTASLAGEEQSRVEQSQQQQHHEQQPQQLQQQQQIVQQQQHIIQQQQQLIQQHQLLIQQLQQQLQQQLPQQQEQEPQQQEQEPKQQEQQPQQQEQQSQGHHEQAPKGQLEKQQRTNSKKKKVTPSREPCVCAICHLRLSRKHALKVHMARIHPALNAPTSNCKNCSAVFTTTQSLKAHVKRRACNK